MVHLDRSECLQEDLSVCYFEMLKMRLRNRVSVWSLHVSACTWTFLYVCVCVLTVYCETLCP